MAYSKITVNGQTVMDITDTTATAEDVAEGAVFYAANGVRTLGTRAGSVYELLASVDTEDTAEAAVSSLSQTFDESIEGYDGYLVVLGATKNATATNINDGAIHTGSERLYLNYYGSFLPATPASYPDASMFWYIERVAQDIYICRAGSENTRKDANTEYQYLQVGTGSITGFYGLRKIGTSNQAKISFAFSAPVQGIRLRMYGIRRGA